MFLRTTRQTCRLATPLNTLYASKPCLVEDCERGNEAGVLAHMGLNEGFPEIVPVAEHTLAGLSLGESYQRTMNAIIGNRPLSAYYDTGAPIPKDSTAVEAARQKDPANDLLLNLWADPALVPISSR